MNTFPCLTKKVWLNVVKQEDLRGGAAKEESGCYSKVKVMMLKRLGGVC